MTSSSRPRRNKLRFSLLECLIALALTVTPSHAAILAESTFDGGTEGWQVIGDAGPILWSGSSGNPPGCLQVTDTGVGGVIYWIAPPAFRGDLTEAYRGFISFDHSQSQTGGYFSRGDVILTGGGLTLFAVTSERPPAFPSWGSRCIRFSAWPEWRVGSETGPIATEAQLLTALATVTDLRIRAEYNGSAAEIDYLDNVRVHTVEQQLIQVAHSDFEQDLEAWSAVGDVDTLEWVASAGNPGGAARVRDKGTSGVIYWLAPPAYLGNQAHCLGGYLSFDLASSVAPNFTSPAAVELIGLADSAYFSISGGPPVHPTWKRFETILAPCAGWRMGSTGGPEADDSDLISILENLQTLRIRAEYNDMAAELCYLDNVALFGRDRSGVPASEPWRKDLEIRRVARGLYGVTIDTEEVGDIVMEAFDVQGKLISRSMTEVIQSGRSELNWTSKTTSGGSLTKGLYFLRVTTSANIHTGRFLVLD